MKTNVLRDGKWATVGEGMEETLPKFRQHTLRERLRSWLRWEDLTVAGKEVKGFVVTPTIAATVVGVTLTAFLGAVGWAYSSNTKDSRETLKAITRMETLLDERTRSFEREQDKLQADLKDERTLNQLHRENQEKQQWKMVLALKAKGINVE